MAEDQENKEDKFDAFTDAFTMDGEAVDYISLEQARVLAIRHARDNTEFYGAKYSGINLVWEIFEHDREDGEDYYDIRLSFRPAGRFRGEPGIEQFIIGKTGNIEIRQMLDEPTGLDLPESPDVSSAAEPPVTTQPPAAPASPPTSSPPAPTPPIPTQPRATAAPTSPPRPKAPMPAAPPRRSPLFKALALVGLALVVLGVIAAGAIVFVARSGEEPVVERERVTRDRPRRATATPVVVPTALPASAPAVAEPLVDKEALRATTVPVPEQKATPTQKESISLIRKQYSNPPAMTIHPAAEYIATIKTNKGDIVVELLPGPAPKTVNNFVFLAEEGFYDGIIFHRVIPDFMVQTGDPTGTGTGGAGYKFQDEFNPLLVFDRAGILAMANAGPNTNSSQFFITTVPTPHLNGKHTIFGRIIEGQTVADAISIVPTAAGDNPIDPIIIQGIEVITTSASAADRLITPVPDPIDVNFLEIVVQGDRLKFNQSAVTGSTRLREKG